MNTAKKLLYTGLGAIATVYIMGVAHNTKELSDKIEPLREEFEVIAKEGKSERITNPSIDANIPLLDYDGKLDAIVKAKNNFAKANGSVARGWISNIEAYNSDANIKTAHTPSPLALNPFTWDNEINTSAIKKYFMDTYGKNYKKRIEQVHKVLEQKYRK